MRGDWCSIKPPGEGKVIPATISTKQWGFVKSGESWARMRPQAHLVLTQWLEYFVLRLVDFKPLKQQTSTNVHGNHLLKPIMLSSAAPGSV
jgi:hypothetical protein